MPDARPTDPTVPAGRDFPVPARRARLLLTTAPPEAAHRIAHALVEERLAACVSLVPGVRSVYRWQEAVHDEPETVLVIKTVTDRLAALSGRLEALHPYEVPEQLVLGPEGGSAAYLDWLSGAVGPVEGPAGES
ncbi:MAG: divalent-cation tolerance protein CutA [Planctomycetota bacterium]|jgi:periplasmic divalent cation tolerance protein